MARVIQLAKAVIMGITRPQPVTACSLLPTLLRGTVTGSLSVGTCLASYSANTGTKVPYSGHAPAVCVLPTRPTT